MPAFPWKISSMAVLGRPEFIVEPPAVYLAMAEQAILAQQSVSVPIGGGDSFYHTGTPAWVEDIIAEGIPWTAAERATLEFLFDIIPQVVKGGSKDPSYMVLKGGNVKIVPFAYPIIFETKGGPRNPGAGLWVKNKNTVFILRSSLITKPMRLIASAYHEGWHAVAGDDGSRGPEAEIVPHDRQLELGQGLLTWLAARKPSSAAEVEIIQHHTTDVNSMMQGLRTTLDQLRRGK